MRVSYLVTVFNNVKYLPGLVASIDDQQGDFEKELIIADDGSSSEQLDDLQTFLAGFSVFPVHFVSAVVNTGPAQCFNRGLEAVTGDIIMAIDADDQFAPDATSYFLDLLDRYDADFIYGRRRRQGVKGDAQKVEVIDDPLAYVLKRQVVHMCFAARSGLLQKAEGADPRLFIQDQSLSLRMAQNAKRMVRSDKTTVYAAEDQIGLSVNKAQQHHDRFWMVMNFLDDHPALNKNFIAHIKDTARSSLWKFQRDQGALAPLSFYFWIYILGRLSGFGPSIDQLKDMARSTFRDASIRRVTN